jgi:mRNA degradation ribonuclease J1/J2
MSTINESTNGPATGEESGQWFDYEVFASMVGFQAGLGALEDKGEIKWTNTATHMRTGGVHGLRYKVEKDDSNYPLILLEHWVHWPGGKVPSDEQKRRSPQIMKFKTETKTLESGRVLIRPVSAEWMGKTYTETGDLMKLMHFLQATSEEIRNNIAQNTQATIVRDSGAFPEFQQRVSQTQRRDEIPNLYSIAENSGMKTATALPGMNYNGEFNFGEPVKSTTPPAYPVQLLRSMFAFEAEIAQHGIKPFTKSHTAPDIVNGGYEGVTYSFSPANDSFSVHCKIWNSGTNGKREETDLYQVNFKVDDNDPSLFRLNEFKMLGHTPDITDHKGVARAIRAMKYIHLAIQRGEAPQLSDIIHEHDLKSFLTGLKPPTDATPENPRTMIWVAGANEDAAFSKKELSIGSNGLVMIQDFIKNNQWVKQGIGIDWGVTFGDPKKDYYHTITPNFGRYTRHPNSPHIQPYVDTFLNLETHEHEDHLRGVARLVKFGYTLPPMIMNKHSKRVLGRMMGEEGVTKNKKKDVMARCHVVDIKDSVNRVNPDEIKIFEYGDTVLEQGTEVIWSEAEQQNKYFPVVTTYTKQHPESKTRIRIGPAGHSAHSLMFDVEGVLYTGDYKLDQTINPKYKTDLDWLKKCRETASVHIQESTNATKDVPFNATTAEVKENRKEILRVEQRHRIFYDTIGSNALDLEKICEAAGEIRRENAEAHHLHDADDDADPKLTEEKREARRLSRIRNTLHGEDGAFKYIIFAGSAIRNKYGDMNDSDNFKTEMLRKYGIKTLHADSETAKELLRGDNNSNYMVIMTGTQDEALSLTHRVSRDLHDLIRLESGDVIIHGQMPIPGDNRIEIRRALNNRYRHEFDCTVYDTYEMGQLGKPIYASSHASPDDYRQIHAETGDLLKLLHHGGPAQLNKMMDRMKEMGARAMIPDKQTIYKVHKETRTVSVAAETPEERVGYREIRADQDEFFKKQRQQATVMRIKDRWCGDVAEAMYRYEHLVEKRAEAKKSHAPTHRGANISNEFNEGAGVADFPKIGILHPEVEHPYYEKQRNIKAMIAMDTETTGANPAVDVHTDASFIAATNDGKILRERTLRHGIRKYMLPSAGALAVTHNEDPTALHKGLPLRKYALRLLETYREWPQKLLKDKDARAVFAGWRNGVFDDHITLRMLGMAVASHDMKPMATNGNLQLDLYNLYTALIALAPDKVGVRRDAQGNCIRTLQAACEENGVEYDPKKAHGSLYDAKCTLQLLFKFKAAAPEIFEQMLMNCDFSASRRSPMIDHILGQNLSFNDQAPLFAFVDRRDRTATPRIGALVTIDTVVSKASDAIVLDLAKADIHQLEQLSDRKLLELMNDKDGPFAVMKMNNSPCWFPPQMVWQDAKIRARAIGKLPKSTLLQRANALKQLRSNGQEIGANFMSRVQKLYPQSKLCYNKERVAANGNTPSKAFKLPNERIFSLFDIIKPVNQIRDRHIKEAAKLLKEIQPSEAEFKRDFDKQSFWKNAVARVHALSAETGGRNQYKCIEDLRFLIEWQVYDMNPNWLPEADRIKINALKSAMLHGPDDSQTMTIERFRKELAQIERDPEAMAKIVGIGDDAAQKWTELKAMYLGYAEELAKNRKFLMTPEKRQTLRAFSRANAPGYGS